MVVIALGCVQFNVFINLSKGENYLLRYLVVVGILLKMALSATPVWALEVVDAMMTTVIIDREPADRVEVFPVQTGKLYCFSRIIGSENPTVVYHVWYRGKQMMSRVKLPVNSADWRTWSAKSFLEDWSGEWRVEIQDVDGNLLREVGFLLRE